MRSMRSLSIAKAVEKLAKTQSASPETAVDESIAQDDQYTEDDLPEEEVEEEVDQSTKQEILQKIMTDGETMIDDLIAVNDKKEYSKLIKLLQSAVRIAGELLESDDLLNQ